MGPFELLATWILNAGGVLIWHGVVTLVVVGVRIVVEFGCLARRGCLVLV